MIKNLKSNFDKNHSYINYEAYNSSRWSSGDRRGNDASTWSIRTAVGPPWKIHVDRKKFIALGEKSLIWKQPILRGMAGLYESMKMGMETLHWSADIAMPDEKNKPKSRISDFFSSLFAIALLFHYL
ncbi:MAG: hypothetical protein Ct9H90mP20_1080 [Candidatus Neomarinimicrobiota bacterium]|nr:MAG: hypothetical protein Ct9H90mP20_1080 [Candidatus Neomarinimicrobiota bacterium]